MGHQRRLKQLQRELKHMRRDNQRARTTEKDEVVPTKEQNDVHNVELNPSMKKLMKH